MKLETYSVHPNEEATELPRFPFARTCPFDPPPEIARLRDEGSLAKVQLFDGRPAWLATRYDDVRAICTDARMSSDTTKHGYPEVFAGRSSAAQKERSLISSDGQKHAELRRMVTSWFTIKRAEGMRPRIQQLVDGLLDDLEAKGSPADLVPDFALPIPTAVICWLLGVPMEDHLFFQQRAGTRLKFLASASEVATATNELTEYLSDLLERKLVEPGDDILSDLVHHRVATGQLERSEVVDLSRQLLIAGHESTANMIALGAMLLLEHPDQLDLVRADETQVVPAVEELLRYLTIPQLLVGRVATADVEVGGATIQAGEGVRALLNSANRDERAFPHADVLDIMRNAKHHVAFGFGVHQCLGQAYARVEMQVALVALFRRFPDLAVDQPIEKIPFKYLSAVHGVDALPVRW